MSSTTDDFDVIVVGAGSSGCVLAARLSENSSRRVLLIEAGTHFATKDDIPFELASSSSMAASMPGNPYNWSFVGELRPGRVYPLPRGKVIGGSSSVNGMYFIRGRQEDFDEWAALGNDVWSFDKVLPYFKKSETDLDFQDDWHGSDGPIPVRRAHDDELLPVSRAFVESCLEMGFPWEPDKNAAGAEGVGSIPRNSVDGIRMSAAITHLQPALGRPNLRVTGSCLVRRVLVKDGKAVGVEAQQGREVVIYKAKEVVLCAGGIKTPHLLQLSGIGPAALLQEFDVPVVVDNSAVGANIRDHPRAEVYFKTREPMFLPDATVRPIQTCLNFTAPGSSDIGDLQINCMSATLAQLMKTERFNMPSYLKRPLASLKALSRLSPEIVIAQARSRRGIHLMCSLDREHSTGTVRLSSADPAVQPEIQLNYLSHPDDLPRLRYAVQQAISILGSGPFEAMGAEISAPLPPDWQDDDALDRWIVSHLESSFHTAGGARMGSSANPDSVVDQYCRVHGVTGLRVVDLSISPNIVRRGPNATAVMIGERASAFFD